MINKLTNNSYKYIYLIMKIFFNPDRKTSHRISKDTSGGYGTGNDFGDT